MSARPGISACSGALVIDLSVAAVRAAAVSLFAISIFASSAAAQGTPLDIGDNGRIRVSVKSYKDLRDENLIRQGLDYSCAAAALATLLTFGMDDPTSELEILAAMIAGLGRDEEALRQKEGFSLLDLQRVAHGMGYHAEGFRIGPDALDQLTAPVIVFIRPRGYEHFAVLRGVRGNRAYLADPALGNVRRADYDFLDMWLGDDGMGIIFVIQPERGGLPKAPPLALAAGGLPRPELLSTQQLRQVGPASFSARGLR